MAEYNVKAKVLSIRTIATRIIEITLEVGKEIAALAKPGQYCSFAPRDKSEVNRHPFSIAAAGYDFLVFIIDIVGPNTEYYSGLKEADEIMITKPLGRAIVIDDKVKNVILVLGGVGSPAGMHLAEKLREKRISVTVILGARSEDRLIGVREYLDRHCTVKSIIQKDAQGPFATDGFEDVLKFAKPDTVVVTCGPMPMMLKVADMCGEDFPCLMILETVFACSMGTCYGCTVFLANGKTARVCVDGPAIWAHDLDLGKLRQAHLAVEFKGPIETCDLSVDLSGVKLVTPVMVASAGQSVHSLQEKAVDMNKVGALITKGLSLNPKGGNPTGRVYKTPSGMANAIGIENIGLRAFLEYDSKVWLRFGKPVFVNIFGNLIEEYIELTEGLNGRGFAGVEVNISCPNTEAGGLVFGVDPQSAYDVIKAVRRATSMTVIAKLTPNVTDITVIARACEAAGADAISAINTFIGMVINPDTHRPVLANVTGGISGPAIRPMAVNMVRLVANSVKIPVIGIGGIDGPEAALQHIIAGASAVQICTAGYSNPNVITETVEGIEAHMLAKGFPTVADLSGSLVLPN